VRRIWAACALLALASGVTTPAYATDHTNYYLPWDGGVQRHVLQGNGAPGCTPGPAHCGIDMHAWDFSPDNWRVRAARTGTIRDFRDNEGPGQCNPAYADHANYVRVLHTGGVETLYAHLEQNSVSSLGIIEGQAVVRHSIMGEPGDSGYICGTLHLHYQVQDDCPLNLSGFCQSVPSTFSDAGIPTEGQDPTSGNTYQSEPTPGWPPQGWANFNNLGKPTTTGLTSGVDPSSWEEGRVDVFARSSTNAIVWKTRTSTGWEGSWKTSPGTPAGLTLRGGPTAVSWGSGRIDLFARGSDDQLWHRVWIEPGPWAAWESLQAPEGGLTADPDVSSWAANRLDVFVRAADNKLWHRAWTGSPPWSDWEHLDGSLTSAPSAVSWGTNRIDVFARGASNHLYHRVYIYGSGWFGWENLCSNPYPNCSLTSAPDAASWVTDRIDVFVRGASNHLYHRVWAGGPSWVNFANLCAAPYPTCTVTEDPGVVSWGFGRIDAFVRGSDNGLYQRRYGL
jgi:hypothetical protein